ncbi:MAG: hypothetical protein D6803_00215 [Anaerolineae bacterium]|nr:MAG: hypothetical protein D6803_00215 [Anaerolineae bacterium]
MPDESVAINRREFLNLAWLASLGFIFVDVAGMTVLFAMPRFKEGEFGGVFVVGSKDSLPDVDAPPANYPKVKFWLSHTEEGVQALYKVCTHLGCLYNWNNQEGKFICPCHGSQFQKNGTYIQGPAPRSLDQFVIQILDAETGEVLAETPPEGGPVPLPEDREVVIKVNTGARIIGQRHN